MRRIHETVYIADGGRVIADVTIGEDSSVWYNAVVRGDECPVVIGARSNVQDCCILHGDIGGHMIVGDDVTIGHGAILHTCIIEDGVLIGMGAIVLHGAVVHKNAMVAAGSVVPPGMEVPEGTLAVGSPAKLKRTLTSEDIQANFENTHLYVKMARHAREGLCHFNCPLT